MKYSVLIPTRNRLEYLRYTVASVLRQEYCDLEIIISDNASEVGVADYVLSLNDPRVKYSRSEMFLTISESWNRSLDLSSGDYVIMLGDDDILLKRYFETMDKLTQTYQFPDLIYTDSYLYAYPGVLPHFSEGLFCSFGAVQGMPQSKEPFFLNRSLRVEMVRNFLKFNTVYATNMQHALIHRSLIEKVKRDNKFFHSPYPDFYVMSALFIEAEKMLVYPKEAVVVGITPKSHGYYHYNNKKKEGADFLNIGNDIASIPGLLKHVVPPFDSAHTFWLAAIYLVERHFSSKKCELNVDYNRYRISQIHTVLQSIYRKDEKSRNEYAALVKNLSFAEIAYLYAKLMFFYANKIAPNIIKLLKNLRRVEKSEVFIGSPNPNSPLKLNPYSNALEIFEQVEPSSLEVHVHEV